MRGGRISAGHRPEGAALFMESGSRCSMQTSASSRPAQRIRRHQDRVARRLEGLSYALVFPRIADVVMRSEQELFLPTPIGRTDREASFRLHQWSTGLSRQRQSCAIFELPQQVSMHEFAIGRVPVPLARCAGQCRPHRRVLRAGCQWCLKLGLRVRGLSMRVRRKRLRRPITRE